MISLTLRGCPVLTDPALRPGLDALSWWLADHHYSVRAIDRILAFTAVEGTPTGSAYLEADDEAGASEAFTAALEPLPEASAAWECPDSFIDVESLLEPRGAVSIAPPAPPRRPWSVESDREADRRRFEADPELAGIIRDEPSLAGIYADCLPPVSGGAPDPDDDPMGFPRAKSAADRRRDMADVAGWFAAHPGS